MKIKKFKYSENENTSNEWILNEFELNDINLIVGKNSVGKSRVLNVITALSFGLTPQTKPFRSAHYCVSFESDNQLLYYEIRWKNGVVEKEELRINSELFIERNIEGIGKMKNMKVDEGKLLEFKIPTNQVSIFRYDEYQYPYLKDINDWASNLRRFNFNTDLGRLHLAGPGSEIDDKNFDSKETTKVIELVMVAFKKFKAPFVKNVIRDFNSLGYRITSIDLQPITSIEFNNGGKIIGIVVQEAERRGLTDQITMSTGMFRALSIVIHLAFYELNKVPGTVLIDDIGEGLDYDRATKLIQLLSAKALTNHIQLLISTNDRFVMNKVPLEYWQILSRKGERVSVSNQINSKKTFEEFEFTGLNNFDFFATEFYKEGFKEDSNVN